MSLWGNLDAANNAPVSSAMAGYGGNTPQVTANAEVYYANTQLGAFSDNQAIGIFGVTYKDNIPDIRNTKVIQILEYLRKKNINLTKADIKNGVGLFSIVNNTQTRTFMKSNWKGMDLIDNKYYPKGFQFK